MENNPGDKANTTYSAKPMTASEIQQLNYEKQMKQYQQQLQQYQQQWVQYQQQVAIAQQLSQQYPQYIQTMPTMPMHIPMQNFQTYGQQQQFQQPIQKVPYPGQQGSSIQPKSKQFRQKNPKNLKPNIVKTCTPCEKEFTSKQQYEIHMQSHITCKFCPYEAHYKLVAKHQEVAHQNGYQCID
jgi:uncharacterized membrane-anchored protein YhcB (DUF1043 family)